MSNDIERLMSEAVDREAYIKELEEVLQFIYDKAHPMVVGEALFKRMGELLNKGE